MNAYKKNKIFTVRFDDETYKALSRVADLHYVSVGSC